MEIKIPDGYKSILSVYDTREAISLLKRLFEDRLAALFKSLPGYPHRCLSILIPDLTITSTATSAPYRLIFSARIRPLRSFSRLQSGKRLALKRYNFFPGKGLYRIWTPSAATRTSWITFTLSMLTSGTGKRSSFPENRNLDYLKLTVMDIVKALCDTQDTMQAIYPQLQCLPKLERNVTFVTSQELEDMYPDMTSKQRENAFTRA